MVSCEKATLFRAVWGSLMALPGTLFAVGSLLWGGLMAPPGTLLALGIVLWGSLLRALPQAPFESLRADRARVSLRSSGEFGGGEPPSICSASCCCF